MFFSPEKHRYLYNETVTIQSVMTALTTLYAAHKYMCPGLAKIVVNYLRENLTEKNVLLVLQHICLYCNAAAVAGGGGGGGRGGGGSGVKASPPRTIKPPPEYWDAPITVGPSPSSASATAAAGPTSSRHLVRLRSSNSKIEEIEEDEEDVEPSAPPLMTEEGHENHPLLPVGASASAAVEHYGHHGHHGHHGHEVEEEVTEDDLRDFEAGMSVGSNGGKINCCAALLKDCLELIDAK